MFLEKHFPSIPEELSSAALTGLREAVGLGRAELHVQGAARSHDNWLSLFPATKCYLRKCKMSQLCQKDAK